jgi:hypothetical protein
MLGLFERRFCRSIFGAVQDSGEENGVPNYVHYMMNEVWPNVLKLMSAACRTNV